MAVINFEIPQRVYEVVRDNVAAILADELNNQFTLTGNPIFNAKVFTERGTTPSHVELPIVNVTLTNYNVTSKEPEYDKVTAYYDVTVYTKAKNVQAASGSQRSSADCAKLAGVIYYILASPYYYRLGLSDTFGLGSFESKMIEGIEFGKIDSDDAEASNISAARLTLAVKYTQDNGALQPGASSGTDTVLNNSLITINNI